jgi:peptidoglycan hydrolase CwlO-like protein
MSKQEQGNTPVAQGTIVKSRHGATNTKESKVKKKPSDSKKLQELRIKHKAMQEGVIDLVTEITDAEIENDRLQEKITKLEIVIIEQRGAIGYLEHKLKEKNNESA